MCLCARDSVVVETPEGRMMNGYGRRLVGLFKNDVFLVLYDHSWGPVWLGASSQPVSTEFNPKIGHIASIVRSGESAIRRVNERGRTDPNLLSFCLNCYSGRVFVSVFQRPQAYRLVIINRMGGDDQIIEAPGFHERLKDICTQIRGSLEGLAPPHAA
jgi:hypothetical protein